MYIWSGSYTDYIYMQFDEEYNRYYAKNSFNFLRFIDQIFDQNTHRFAYDPLKECSAHISRPSEDLIIHYSFFRPFDEKKRNFLNL